MVKKNKNEDKGFILNQKKIDDFVLTVYNAAIKGQGIFKGGPSIWKREYLPQWRIPKELEYSPQREETKDPKATAQFLWHSILFERQAKSSFLEYQLHQIWHDPKKRWFFNPKEISQRDLEDIAQILKEDMKYNLRTSPNQSFAEAYRENAARLVSHYDSDPINLIHRLKVEESRWRHMEFDGVGTGIANLNIIHFADRKIAAPLDPENILFKVDVHKGRIPLNVEAITLLNGNKEIHVCNLVNELEQAYWKTCNKYKLDPKITDAAIWVIGSLVCTKRSYKECLNYCPLASNNMCVANTPLNKENGRYLISDDKDKRIDTRRDMQGKHQLHFLPFYKEEFLA